MPNAPKPSKKSIVLVGLMGVGKSSVGRRLAKRLGVPFVDADEEIEAAAGLTVTEIFDRYGEDQFRDGERRVIARLIDGPRAVIATGGGAFMDAGTRALILERCLAIWLDGDVEVLAKRVARRNDRPLLRDRDPEEVLRGLAAVRNPFYAEAHFRVSSEKVAVEQTVDLIIDTLAQR